MFHIKVEELGTNRTIIDTDSACVLGVVDLPGENCFQSIGAVDCKGYTLLNGIAALDGVKDEHMNLLLHGGD